MTSRGLRVDFIGTSSDFGNPYVAEPMRDRELAEPWVYEADNDHNGYSGWGSDDVRKVGTRASPRPPIATTRCAFACSFAPRVLVFVS